MYCTTHKVLVGGVASWKATLRPPLSDGMPRKPTAINLVELRSLTNVSP